jgi:hypothetical protein
LRTPQANGPDLGGKPIDLAVLADAAQVETRSMMARRWYWRRGLSMERGARRHEWVVGLLHREGDLGEGLVPAGLDRQHLGLVLGATLEERRGNRQAPGAGR